MILSEKALGRQVVQWMLLYLENKEGRMFKRVSYNELNSRQKLAARKLAQTDGGRKVPGDSERNCGCGAVC